MDRAAKIVIGAIIATFCGITLGVVLWGSQQTNTIQSTSPTRFEVTLRCDECAEAGMDINLWASPDNRRVVGSVPNLTRATVLDEDFNSGGTLHYQVSAGGVTGWVSELMVEQ
jgi:hypothetical protein